MASKDDKEITVVAQCTVSNTEKSVVVKSFDTAWHTALREFERPVHVSFDGFVRKDS